MAKYIEYVCDRCGMKSNKWDNNGKPDSGHCPNNRGSDGKPKPHVWKKNRVLQEK